MVQFLHMEKRRAHYLLSEIKRLVANPNTRYVTTTALQGANALGMGEREIVEAVMNLHPADFYKAMTTLRNSRLWQDVYRPYVRGQRVYLKIQVDQERGIVISFKEA